MKYKYIYVLLFLAGFSVPAMAWQNSSVTEPVGVPPVRIVYFVPSDMEPIPDREERLGRVMRCVQDFYRKGMEKHGYGLMTFALEWNSSEKLKLYEVRGKKKQEEYGRNDYYIVRNEVRDVLKSQYEIDAENELLVIFQLLLKRDGDISIELGPYVGNGSSLSGTAWVYEDDRLDSDLLTSKEPGGYYHGHCSLGKFNTHYIGGVAHEMGHAFSLPHVREWDSQRSEMGNSLMGSGNHTFGRDLRNEGTGTFLSQTSALRLSTIRAFAGDLPDAEKRGDWNIEELSAKEERSGGRRAIVLSGRITASPKLTGIIAYNDNMNIPADYDAKAWMTKDLKDGRFQIIIDELETAPYQLRLDGVHENGKTSRLSVNYQVSDNEIDFGSINSLIAEQRLRRFFRDKKADEIKLISENTAEDKTIRRMASHLFKLLTEAKEPIIVAKLPKKLHSADLTDAKFVVERTGWLGVHRGRVPGEDLFIRIGNQFFESGLYAHAPSNYTVELGGVWKTLSVGYGLQDGNEGPVRFIVLGDGKELFRSDDVKDHSLRKTSISVEKVRKLEMIVESAVQGNSGAWGIWIEPEIRR